MKKKLQQTKGTRTKNQVKKPDKEFLQDEFAGQGGSYLIDPATHKRVKTTGETNNG